MLEAEGNHAPREQHQQLLTECLNALPLSKEGVGSSGRQDGSSLTSSEAIIRAAAVLRSGNVVAIPTETVYGLAANALSASAVASIFKAKRRPSDNPLIVHVCSLEMLSSLYPPGWTLPPVYEAAVKACWPGPLTILLPRSLLVPDAVTCGLPTMAVRMPAHPVALQLIEACGFPLAAPSANSSGRPSPTLASHVLADLDGRIPLVLDGGACGCGVESTVLDALRSPPAILRPGGVTHEQLSQLPGLGGLQVYKKHFVDAALEAAPTTPGMKYRHYSPTAPVHLLDPGEASGLDESALQGQLAAALRAAVSELAASGTYRRIGVLRTSLAHTLAGPMAARSEPEHLDCLSLSCNSHTQQQHHHKHHHQNQQGQQLAEEGSGSGSGTACLPAAADGTPVHAAACHGGSACNDASGPPQPPAVLQFVLGPVARPGEVARELFRGLRWMDEQGVQVIVAEGVRDAGEGVAVMNRLRKAASTVQQLGSGPEAHAPPATTLAVAGD